MTEAPEDVAKPRRSLSGGSRLWLVFTALMMALAAVTALYPGGAAMVAGPAAQGFDLQGHRGARGLMPENSLPGFDTRSEEHTSELQSLMRRSSDGFCLKTTKEQLQTT